MVKLTLCGHEERYAVEQLCLALFSLDTEGQVTSTLHRGDRWLTAVTTVTIDGKTTQQAKRLSSSEETVRARRRVLQQSLYLAALPHLKAVPAWGALSGVRPTTLTTKHKKPIMAVNSSAGSTK